MGHRHLSLAGPQRSRDAQRHYPLQSPWSAAMLGAGRLLDGDVREDAAEGRLFGDEFVVMDGSPTRGYAPTFVDTAQDHSQQPQRCRMFLAS